MVNGYVFLERTLSLVNDCKAQGKAFALSVQLLPKELILQRAYHF